MTSTVPATLLGTYTRGFKSHSGQGTVPDSVFAYTLNAASGRLVGCTSGAGQVRVAPVAQDPSNHAGGLGPLTFGKWLAVAGARHQERRRGSGDGVREDLFRFRPGDDLASGADDVRDPISPNADDVATTSHGRALEVSRPCVHCQAHYSK